VWRGSLLSGLGQKLPKPSTWPGIVLIKLQLEPFRSDALSSDDPDIDMIPRVDVTLPSIGECIFH